MGASGSKLGKVAGKSSKDGGSTATRTIGARQIIRKANKEDLFTVATYSILADSEVTDQKFLHWTKNDRKGKMRSALILAEVQAMAASVVCLQAVGGALYEQILKPEMAKLGYEGSMMRLSGKKDDAHRQGVATFFHTGTFQLLKSHNIKLNDTMKEAARTAGLDAKQAGLITGSGALVSLLQLLPDKHSKQHCVVIANTQLCGGATADIVTLEAALLLRELQNYAEHIQDFKTQSNMADVAVGYIIAGDLGGTPKSPQYTLFKRGVLDSKDDKKIRKCPQVMSGKGMSARTQPLIDWFRGAYTHNWGSLKSAYDTVIGHEPQHTVFSDQKRACTDYVWFSGDNLNANTALQVPDQTALEREVGIPNASYPSDHLPLCFGFRFKKSDVFTSHLPFSGASSRGSTGGGDNKAEGDEVPVDDLAPRNLDDILGFKTPTDKISYDRFGRERSISGIAPGQDLAPNAWKAAETRRYG